MRKSLLLFIAALCATVAVNAEKPTIDIDGDNSEWTDIPMLSKPGEFPIIKVATTADAEIGEGNALVYMIQSDVELDQTWEKYPNMFLDKDYNINTNPIECWQYTAMGVDYKATTGAKIDNNWVSFTTAISAHVIEIAIPSSYVTDLQSKFGIAFYYGNVDWYSPQYNTTDYPEISSQNGWLYKHRTISDLCGKHTADEATTHQSIGDATTTIDFGLRDNGYDTARWAAWPINLVEPIQVKVSADVSSSNDWKLQCYLIDMATNRFIDSTNFSRQESYTGTKEIGLWDLSSHPTGSYMLMIKNRVDYSTVQVNSVSFTYAGGNVVEVPSTDALPLTDAILSANASVNNDGYVVFGDRANDFVRWNIHTSGAVGAKVTMDVAATNGHTYVVSVYNMNGEQVATAKEKEWTDASGIMDLGTIAFPAEGNYYIKVTNTASGSTATFKDLTFTAAGGEVVNVPGVLPNDKAILSSGASVNEDGYIAFASTTSDNARWNIHASASMGVSVSMEVKVASGHRFVATLYSMDGQELASIKEKEWNETEGIQILGNLTLPTEGNYYIVITNLGAGSQATFKNLTLTAAGGEVVNVPGVLPNDKAILSSGASVNEDGYIAFASTTSDNARWNIHASASMGVSVSMEVKVVSGHEFIVTLYTMGGQELARIKEKEWNQTEGIINLGNLGFPAEGNYYVNVTNKTSGSTATFKNLTLTAAGGEVVNAGLLPNEEVVLVGSVTRDENNNIKSSGEKTVPTDEYFYWNVNFPKEGYYDISLNVAAKDEQGTSSGHIYKVFIDEEEQACTQEGYSGLAGDCELTESAVLISTAGVHKIKIVNAQEWSSAMLHSVTLTYVGLIITDTDEDIDFTAYKDQTVGLRLQRTFKANMWNPICLPFAVSHEQLVSILKAEDAYYLKDASLENQKLSIYLQKDNGIYQGVPYFFKPSENVENPVFEDVTIAQPDPQATNTGVIRLRGTYASHELDNPSHVLLVGANNTLFFPSDEHPYIKSMRAYFILKDVEPSQMPRFAAFVEPGNAPTEMIIVGGEAERQKGHRKVLVDGQIRIQHEGKCYSILGLER